MKQFFSKVTLSHPFGQDHSCCFLNRREALGSESTVKFFLLFVENTKFRKVSDTFCAVKKTLRAQEYSRKNFVRNIKILKETCKNEAILTRSCKISARIMHSLARNLPRIFFSTRELQTDTKKTGVNCRFFGPKGVEERSKHQRA